MKRVPIRKMIHFLLLFFIISCNAKDSEQTDNNLETGEQLGRLTLEQGEGLEGFVSFSSGTIIIKNETGEKPVNIGDIIRQSDVLETGVGAYCEIQFGETAVIYVEESTVLVVDTLFATQESSEINLNLHEGTVLCKVERLLRKGDDFTVTTESAVCGVRGTQFSVTQSETKETTLAVREGTVAVLSPELATVQQKAKADERTQNAIQSLGESAILVANDEQIQIQKATFSEVNTQLTEINRLLDDVLSDEGTANEESILQISAAAESISSNLQNSANQVAQQKSRLNPDQVENLAKADNMTIYNVIPEEKEEAVTLYKISIRTIPPTATISDNGRRLGTGEFSRIYQEGETLNIHVEQAGFESHDFTIEVNESNSRMYTIRLNATSTEETPEITPVVEDTIEEVPVTDNEEKPKKQELINVEITVIPEDAELTVNGETFTGRFSTETSEGEIYEISAGRNGFKSETLTLTAGPALSQYRIELEPAPVEKRFNTGGSSAVNSLQTTGGIIFLADSSGSVKAFSPETGLLWQTTTANRPNENSYPVLASGKVYLTGVKTLNIINANNGNEFASISLSGDMVHLFGRKVLPFDGQVVYPSNTELIFLDPASGESVRTISIPGGSRMSPGSWNGKLVIANQKGELLLIDPQSGQIQMQLGTQALQPVATRVAIQGNTGVFSGRKGTVVAVDLSAGAIQWQKNLNGTIYAEITTGAEGCYPYLSNTLNGLSWADGSNLFTPITGVSCAPLYHNGMLYYGNNSNELIIASAATGRTLKRLNVGGVINATPVIVNNKIICIAGDELLVIDPEGIVP